MRQDGSQRRAELLGTLRDRRRLPPDRQRLGFGQRADIDEETIGRYLYTAGSPDPDLLIRTSGEMRVSNFLLWQIAYTELWVTDALWPDFRRRELFEAICEYQNRERRFGAVRTDAEPVGSESQGR